MRWHDTPSFAFLLGAAAISLTLAIITRRRQGAPGGLPFTWLLVALAVWSVSYALELSSADMPTALLWARAQYLGIVAVPSLWLAFAMQYTGLRPPRYRWAIWAAVPLITLLLVWSNQLHGLIWRAVQWRAEAEQLVVQHGAAFWAWSAFAYAALGAGSYLLIRSLQHAPRSYRWQAVSLLLAATAPWVGNFLYLSGISQGLDLTPFAFIFSCVMFSLSIRRFHLFDIIPVARDTVIEGMSDGVIVIDLQQRIVDVNPAAERLLRRRGADLIGRPVDQVFAHFSALIARFDGVFEAREELMIDQDGQERIFDLSVAPLYNRFGSLAGRLALWRDITEQKHTADTLRTAQDAAEAASRTKTTFLSNISHELRTPLTAIFGYSELLEEQARQAGNTDLISDLRHIQTAGQRLLTLISDLLDLADLEAGKLELQPQLFDVRALVDQVSADVVPLVGQNSNSFALCYEDDPGQMYADPAKLRQVLLNLLSNAAKFTQRGAIRLTVRRLPGADGDQLDFCIADSGIGMTPAQLQRLFQAFIQVSDASTARESSVGLGLLLSRHFCRMMGGDIMVSSEPGRGSTFTVRLPACVQASVAVGQA